ncbi:adenylyl-sulfate kinase [Iodidimonas muriae]|uniref:Multifunctional fusion protein n=1 Tax=Iodidimonas muriae TaxID=261467 RepID=A0ABQ2LFZ6_9PROT|nr:sulfate adenylyltransferase subunit CysN [Iodidimonas muriae]GER08284.1 adenylyl-sulfate kinase [Kordiimonadales bacterium JCM 17843]GGO16434.1 adenylyl-sulfate kinase [Iodidimonas muriae]
MHEPLTKNSDALTAYLKEQEAKDLLRFITCGSVDDGKSTLIGRLLFDSKMIFEDQLAALESDSKKVGTTGDDMDLALLLDGLEAEREQGITIDVAYRFFATDKRRFIVADTPGHEQYTRNMATGASTADAAVILLDARKGILTQTRRHSFICSLLGVRNIVLAVNKMDLVDYSREVFEKIREDYEAFAKTVGYENVTCIPLSALKGDNVLRSSPQLAWYNGPTLLAELETIRLGEDEDLKPFRFPVQWVNRPNLDFRGFSGTIAGGAVAVGDEVVALPSAKTSKIKSIVTFDGTLPRAGTGEAVTLTLEDEIDISRGDMICHREDRASLSDQFEVKIVWMSDEALMPGRPYLFKGAANTASMVVTRLKHSINVNTLEQMATKRLMLNEIGVANISLDRQITFDPYKDNRETGSFIIIDKLTNNTVGAGMIDFGLRRASNIHWQAVDVNKAARAEMKAQKPAVLWFTGLSGSGKSTIANLVEKRLHTAGKHTYMLDGDNVRHGLNKDLGFTEEDRVENIRRVAEVARLMADAGLIVLVSFISPFRSERRMARDLLDDGEFHEVFVDTPLEICEQRDPKGLYKKARSGDIKNFTGIDSPYELPESCELTLKTATMSAEDCAEAVMDYLDRLTIS